MHAILICFTAVLLALVHGEMKIIKDEKRRTRDLFHGTRASGGSYKSHYRDTKILKTLQNKKKIKNKCFMFSSSYHAY